MRIVLVEDNQMLAEGIQKVLLDEGHSVDYFVDGGTPLAITSGDFNNDAMTDIAVASNAKNTIEIYLQRRVFK